MTIKNTLKVLGLAVILALTEGCNHEELSGTYKGRTYKYIQHSGRVRISERDSTNLDYIVYFNGESPVKLEKKTVHFTFGNNFHEVDWKSYSNERLIDNFVNISAGVDCVQIHPQKSDEYTLKSYKSEQREILKRFGEETLKALEIIASNKTLNAETSYSNYLAHINSIPNTYFGTNNLIGGIK